MERYLRRETTLSGKPLRYNILSKMVLDDFKHRYQSASEALEDSKAFDDVVNSHSRYPMLGYDH